jgi:protein-S-isoprenylcysteine O-methyltransferase Ste14
MMVAVGNFLFHYRNFLFPLAYLLLFVPGPRCLSNASAAVALGLGLALAGQALRAITICLAYIRRGGKDRQVYADALVQDGVFAHCRNPLYVGNFLILAGLGLIANSMLFMTLGLGFFVFAYWGIIAAEESFLRRKFGQEYIAYCARVSRIVPNFQNFSKTWAESRIHWRRLIVKEYGSAFAWMTAAILLMLRNYWVRYDYVQHPLFGWALAAGLLLLLMLFAVARFLKKSKILVGEA